MSAFHSGCIGDIIYSIPTLQALDVKTLYIENRSWTKPIVNRIGLFSRRGRERIVAMDRHGAMLKMSFQFSDFSFQPLPTFSK